MSQREALPPSQARLLEPALQADFADLTRKFRAARFCKDPVPHRWLESLPPAGVPRLTPSGEAVIRRTAETIFPPGSETGERLRAMLHAAFPEYKGEQVVDIYTALSNLIRNIRIDYDCGCELSHFLEYWSGRAKLTLGMLLAEVPVKAFDMSYTQEANTEQDVGKASSIATTTTTTHRHHPPPPSRPPPPPNTTTTTITTTHATTTTTTQHNHAGRRWDFATGSCHCASQTVSRTSGTA